MLREFCENLTCARATFLSLCAHRIALVVARREFWDGFRNPLANLGLSDGSRVAGCSFWHGSLNPLGTLGAASLSLWRSAHFDCQGDLVQRSWQEGFLRRVCAKISYRELLHRSCTKRFCQEVSYRDLADRALLESVQRSLARDLLQRSCAEILRGHSSWSCTENLAKRALIDSL